MSRGYIGKTNFVVKRLNIWWWFVEGLNSLISVINIYMSQFTWTYIGDNGALHRVGLFHGDNTGHLMIYCNMRIVVIDFGVTTSKNYSFFINDELCDIAVEENDGKFSYGFKVDEVTDTPRNRGRRKMARLELRQTLIIILSLLALLSVIVFFLLR